jgi:two-component system response regulator YesN
LTVKNLSKKTEASALMKLLIVDDESVIRQGLRNAIEWNKYDIEVVGEAANGDEAFKKVIDLKPDIMMTDIRMPLMDGIELIRKLQEMSLPVRVIILTAYDQNEYYAKAISLGVREFVLKNARSDAILSAVLKVKNDIISESITIKENERQKNLLMENLFLIQSSYVSRILSGKEYADQIAKKAEELDLNLSGPSFGLVMATLSGTDWWAVVNLVRGTFAAYNPFVFKYQENLLSVVLNLPQDTDKTAFDDFIKVIKPYLLENKLVIMYPLDSYEELTSKGDIMVEAMERCCWDSGTCSYIDNSYTLPEVQLSRILESEYRLINTAYTRWNATEISSLIDKWFECLETCKAPARIIKESARRICVALCSTCKKTDETENFIEKIFRCSGAEGIYNILFDIFEDARDESSADTQLNLVLEYIQDNYNQDISLADVAEKIFISPSYLSRIFRKKTGCSFKEWINRLRIEKAKEMLMQTKLKHYEIAEKVGYCDYKHFSEYFHKYCGCSAREYRLNQL